MNSCCLQPNRAVEKPEVQFFLSLFSDTKCVNQNASASGVGFLLVDSISSVKLAPGGLSVQLSPGRLQYMTSVQRDIRPVCNILRLQ